MSDKLLLIGGYHHGKYGAFSYPTQTRLVMPIPQSLSFAELYNMPMTLTDSREYYRIERLVRGNGRSRMCWVFEGMINKTALELLTDMLLDGFVSGNFNPGEYE